jgi:hypothetical protein
MDYRWTSLLAAKQCDTLELPIHNWGYTNRKFDLSWRRVSSQISSEN